MNRFANLSYFLYCLYYECIIKVRSRFFDQLGHETMYASSVNKHFFTKSCHRQTYQNHEQPPQNSDFQSHVSMWKIDVIFPKKIFFEEYWTRRPIFSKKN